MHKQRRNKRDYPLVIGLTGSIGMGKSTAARMFARLGVPVHDSDAAVHRLLAKGGAAVKAVAALFPSAVEKDAVDRKKLGALVFGNPERMKALEAILHPLVQASQRDFLQHMRRRGKKIVVLDIPLLFETGAQKRCDIVVVVTAPHFIQRQRVLGRANMTEEKFAQILSRQMPNQKKILLADVMIDTGAGKALSLKQAKALIRKQIKP